MSDSTVNTSVTVISMIQDGFYYFGDAINKRLRNRDDPTWLCLFRIAFGFILLYQIEKIKGFNYQNLHHNYYEPKFLFPYPGFEFVKPVEWETMVQLTDLAWYSALAAMIGLFYYPTMICATTYYAYVFLLDKSLFLNHNYLIILISSLMCLAPANCTISMDSLLFPSVWRKKRIPMYWYFVFRATMAAVYFYACVWKINPDWLGGEPLRHWLTTQRPDGWFPMEYVAFVRQWWVPYLFSYGGILVDGLAVLAYTDRKMGRKWYIFITITHIPFHIINHFTMSIGVFPWLCIVMYGFTVCPCVYRHIIGLAPIAKKLPKHGYTYSDTFNLALILVFIMAMCYIPARARSYSKMTNAYPNDTSNTMVVMYDTAQSMWDEYGFDFSWKMKLRDKECKGALFVKLNNTDTWHQFDPIKNGHLNFNQYSRMLKTPYMAKQYAEWLADEMEKFPGLKARPIITMDTVCSMNYRPPQRVFKKDFDLADKTQDISKPLWIEPLNLYTETEWDKLQVWKNVWNMWGIDPTCGDIVLKINMTEKQEKWLKKIEL